jgi:hypothetical protein
VGAREAWLVGHRGPYFESRPPPPIQVTGRPPFLRPFWCLLPLPLWPCVPYANVSAAIPPPSLFQARDMTPLLRPGMLPCREDTVQGCWCGRG